MIEARGPGALTGPSWSARRAGLAVGMPARRAEIDVHHLVFNEITDTTVALTITEDLPAALSAQATNLADELVDSVRPLDAIPHARRDGRGKGGRKGADRPPERDQTVCPCAW